jgi:hypothetical protein
MDIPECSSFILKDTQRPHNAYRLELDGPPMRKLQATEQAETDARSSATEAASTIPSPSLTKPTKGDQK